MFISIRYNEGEGQDSYEGVYVYPEDDNPKIFNTNDFVKDFNEALDWAAENNNQSMILMSSTVDDFLIEEPQRYEISSEGMDLNE